MNWFLDCYFQGDQSPRQSYGPGGFLEICELRDLLSQMFYLLNVVQSTTHKCPVQREKWCRDHLKQRLVECGG